MFPLVRERAFTLLPAKQMPHAINHKRKPPSQNPHVKPLEQRPLPGVRLASHHCHRADTLEREHIEDHQTYRRQRRIDWFASVVVLLFTQRLREIFYTLLRIIFAHVIDRGHGADKNFARRERAHNADSHFPIKAQRLDDWLDGATHHPSETVTEIFASFFFL